ncbi:MAG: hypothetical protein ACJ78Z_04585, partial [Myxococcales bacterium]
EVDLEARLITVRRSYDRETTKGGHEDVVPIAPALAPYLRAAIDASPEDLRDGVTRIGRAPFADSLLTEPARALPALKSLPKP